MWYNSKKFKIPRIKPKLFSNDLLLVKWDSNTKYSKYNDSVDIENVLSFRDFISKNLDPFSYNLVNQNLWYGNNLKNLSLNKLNDELLNCSKNLEENFQKFNQQKKEVDQQIKETKKVEVETNGGK